MSQPDVQDFGRAERTHANLAIAALLVTVTGTVLSVAFGYLSPARLLLGAGAVFGCVVLVAYPEIALAGLLVIGTLKGNPLLADAPIDLTVALTLAVIAGCVLKSGSDLRNLRVRYPMAYLCYVPFLAMMIFSLTYTPNPAAGLDKTGRFLIFCGTAIFAPFLIFKSKASLRRFFLTLAALGLVVAMDSFSSLGGGQRLVSTGGDTIQLGHDAALAIVVIWYLLIPGKPMVWRVGLYGLVMVLCVALIGAGSRGPVVALSSCILFSLVVHKKLGMQMKSLVLDLALLVVMGLAVIPSVGIPQSSYDYLARLGDSDMHRFLGPREALMELGWKLMFQHPLTGVGIGGYPVLFRGVGAWPHNMVLEIGAEMGIFSALIFCCLAVLAFREALRQLGNSNLAYNTLDALVFAFLMFEFIDSMNTGSINDNRSLWLAMALPFVLRTLRATEPSRLWRFKPNPPERYRDGSLRVRRAIPSQDRRLLPATRGS